MTRRIMIKNMPIGGGAPISVQTMTNTDTADADATLDQIKRLAAAGADIVRISVYNEQCVKAVRRLVDESPVPLVADIHFDHKLAIGAIENGISKVRINPGNIGGETNVKELADCLKNYRIPVRIGVNAGSLEKELLRKYGAPTAEGLVESALGHARLLEKHGYSDIVISMKCSNVRMTYDACVLCNKLCDYPQHIGITESGTKDVGSIKSAVGIGGLLLAGIGDTIRVSLSGDPEPEVEAGIAILKACGIRKEGLDIISCPTCGRTCINVEEIANRIRKETSDIKTPLQVAVMGCVVNGPGEAREADIGIAGGKTGGALFIKGQAPRAVKGDLAGIMIDEIRKLVGNE